MQSKRGLPTIAECGGFLYLHEHLEGAEMVGVVRGNAVLTKKATAVWVCDTDCTG